MAAFAAGKGCGTGQKLWHGVCCFLGEPVICYGQDPRHGVIYRCMSMLSDSLEVTSCPGGFMRLVYWCILGLPLGSP